MPHSRATRWYLDLKNRVDFALRSGLAWHRRGLVFSNEPKTDLFRALPASLRAQSETRAAELAQRYHLVPFRDASRVDNYLENLYYLDLLEQALEAAGRDLPAALDAADVGCSSWFYVQALHGLLRWWRRPGERQVKLTGFEADPYRLYADFHSRIDHAHAHMRGLAGVTYIPERFRRQPGRFDLILMLFPFVFVDDHLGWGLPAGLFDPRALLANVRASLKPGGLLVIVNQGEAEHLAQRSLLEDAGLRILAAQKHAHPLFYRYDIERYFLVSEHGDSI